jgi:hypothetical protein
MEPIWSDYRYAATAVLLHNPPRGSSQPRQVSKRDHPRGSIPSACRPKHRALSRRQSVRDAVSKSRCRQREQQSVCKGKARWSATRTRFVRVCGERLINRRFCLISSLASRIDDDRVVEFHHVAVVSEAASAADHETAGGSA